MTKIPFDFTDAVEFNRDPIPAGVYQAQIDASYAQKVEYGKVKNTPYITLGYVITSPEEYVGRVVFSRYMISGPGAGNTRKLLRTLEMYDDSQGALFQFNVNMLHGFAVTIKVTLKASPDGGEFNDVQTVVPAP